jgi:hypothetical protein
MNSDRHSAAFGGKIVSNSASVIGTGGKDEGKANGAIVQIFIALGGLLLVGGTEPLKVLLRRGIGKFALGIGSVIVASIFYGLYSYFLLSLGHKQEYQDESYATWLFAGATFYLCLSIGVLICGLMEYFNSINSNYRGDSIFFGFLLSKSISQRVIWSVIEPITCLLIGVLLSLLHPLIGLPVAITSLSFLFNELYRAYRVPQMQKDRIARMQVTNEQTQPLIASDNEFHPVKRID